MARAQTRPAPNQDGRGGPLDLGRLILIGLVVAPAVIAAAVNFVVFIALVIYEPTRGAALVFLGASMLSQLRAESATAR